MYYLLLSIALSSSLFICFKWFERRGVKLLPAICGNYISCIVTGIAMGGSFESFVPDWKTFTACLLLGLLFFIIFYSMGYASSKIGVGITSASAKLSLIIPVTYGAFVLDEPFGLERILALLLAIPAVIFMSYKKGEKLGLSYITIPLLVFTGSGIIDTALNILQDNLNGKSPANVIIMIFSAAFVSSVLASMYFKTPVFKEHRGLGFGLILGVPNYLSVHCMMMALNSGDFTSGQFYLVNNSGVMLLSFLLARILFYEKINTSKWIGLSLSILSIYLILNG